MVYIGFIFYGLLYRVYFVMVYIGFIFLWFI